MMIKAKGIIMKERIWIIRVAQRDVTNVNRSGEGFKHVVDESGARGSREVDAWWFDPC